MRCAASARGTREREGKIARARKREGAVGAREKRNYETRTEESKRLVMKLKYNRGDTAAPATPFFCLFIAKKPGKIFIFFAKFGYLGNWRVRVARGPGKIARNASVRTENPGAEFSGWIRPFARGLKLGPGTQGRLVALPLDDGKIFLAR